jgi:hypothetical protein
MTRRKRQAQTNRLGRKTYVFCNGAKPLISHAWGKAATYFSRLGQRHRFHTFSSVSIQTEGGFAPH